MERRNSSQIKIEILKIISKNKNSINQTSLMRKVNLSFKLYKKYEKDLISKNLIVKTKENNQNFLNIAEKGLEFLQRYNEIIYFLNGD